MSALAVADAPRVRLLDPNALPCTFGGTCETTAALALARTDATGTHTARACIEHAGALTAHLARYVPGWGDVTLTVEAIR